MIIEEEDINTELHIVVGEKGDIWYVGNDVKGYKGYKFKAVQVLYSEESAKEYLHYVTTVGKRSYNMKKK